MKVMALLGFLPNAERYLKTLVEKNLSQPITWVSATDAQVETVIINAEFLGSPQIQKYISKVQAIVVCCYRDADGAQLAKQYQVPGLRIGESNAHAVNTWLQALIDGEENPNEPRTQSQQPVPSHCSSLSKTTEEPVQHNVTPSQPVNSQLAIQTAQSTADNSKKNPTSGDYLLLIDKLCQPTALLSANCGKKKTWIDTENNEVHIDHDRDEISGVDCLKWHSVSQLSLPRHVRRLPLDLWLFETIWQSEISDGLGKISDQAYYKLTRWPRPLNRKGRTEALRLAAFAQAAPVNVATLCAKTDYSTAMVKRFMCAALLAKQLSAVTIAEKQLTAPTPKPQKTEKKLAENKAKLSLLGRFRKKLGLG